MRNLLIFCGFTLLIMSCETPVYFEEPQPSNGKTVEEFSPKYIGKYKSATKKGSFLEIHKNKVTTERFWEMELTKTALDTLNGYRWEGDDLYYYDKQEKTTIKGDTVIIHNQSKSTIFEMSAEHILKSYKKHFFLNKEYFNGWKVQKMKLSNNKKLVLSRISPKKEMENLGELTAIDTIMQSDTSDYVKYYKVKPTDDEFDDILNGGFFTAEDVYIKIKE